MQHGCGYDARFGCVRRPTALAPFGGVPNAKYRVGDPRRNRPTKRASQPQPVLADVDTERCHSEIEVDEESFLALRETAKKERKPVKQRVSEILKQRLRAG